MENNSILELQRRLAELEKKVEIYYQLLKGNTTTASTLSVQTASAEPITAMQSTHAQANLLSLEENTTPSSQVQLELSSQQDTQTQPDASTSANIINQTATDITPTLQEEPTNNQTENILDTTDNQQEDTPFNQNQLDGQLSLFD